MHLSLTQKISPMILQIFDSIKVEQSLNARFKKALKNRIITDPVYH